MFVQPKMLNVLGAGTREQPDTHCSLVKFISVFHEPGNTLQYL